MAIGSNGDVADGNIDLERDDAGDDEGGTNADEGTVGGFGVNPADVTAEQRTKGKRGRPATGRTPRDYAAERARKKETASAPRLKPEPKGAAPRKVKPDAAVNQDFVSFVLMALHEMAAVSFHAQELKLTESEAATLGAASARVLELYNATMTPAQEAWANLALMAFMVYNPKIRAIQQRKKAEKAARVRPAIVPTA